MSVCVCVCVCMCGGTVRSHLIVLAILVVYKMITIFKYCPCLSIPTSASSCKFRNVNNRIILHDDIITYQVLVRVRRSESVYYVSNSNILYFPTNRTFSFIRKLHHQYKCR